MNDKNGPTEKVDQDNAALFRELGVLTTSGECEVTKAADLKKDSAETEEDR